MWASEPSVFLCWACLATAGGAGAHDDIPPECDYTLEKNYNYEIEDYDCTHDTFNEYFDSLEVNGTGK